MQFANIQIGIKALRAPVFGSRTVGWMYLALLMCGPLPMLVKLGRYLWNREQYQFYPLMIAGAALLAWERWQDVHAKKQLRSGASTFSLLLLIVAILFLLAAALAWTQVLAGFATICILMSIAWQIGGWPTLRLWMPCFILLLITLPPPGHWDLTITQQLQQLAVGVSSRMLDLLHVPHVKTGNVLEIPQRRLLVEQACSGINSLMAVLAFSLFYGFWKQRSWWRVLLLLPAAAFFVVWGNIARITGEAWLKVCVNVDVLDGVKHQLIGLFLFIACVGLVLSFDAFLSLIGSIVRKKNPSGDPISHSRQSSPYVAKLIDSNRAGGLTVMPAHWLIAFIMVLVGIWLEARVWNAWNPPMLRSHAQFELPVTIGSWHRMTRAGLLVERPQTEAATSFVWQYHQGNLVATIAIDYPFTGYHELTTCYSLSGWKINSDLSDGSGNSFQRVEMSKYPDQFGYLLFNLNNELGQPVPPEAGFSNTLQDKLNFHRHNALAGATYQIQVLVQQFTPLTEEQREQADELFRDGRKAILAQLISQLDNSWK